MKYSEYLRRSQQCPFCEHTERAIVQNEAAYLTYAAAPYCKDHLLIVPKRHVEHILDLTPEERRSIEELQKMSLEMIQKMGHDGVSVLVREGHNSGSSVAHLHYHVIPGLVIGPINRGDPDREMLPEDELFAEIERIRGHL